MRLISLDTETTGSSPASGDRCIDIGLVEIIDGHPTGRTYQTYVNPEYSVSWMAERVHGLSNAFLSDKPLFRTVAGEILDFIGDSPCVAHGARFDRDMLLHDFRQAGLEIPRITFFDTVPFARNSVSTKAYKLDFLAEHLGVLDKKRGLHSALDDALILARVIERIEELDPKSVERWFSRANPLSPYPKGWRVGAPSRSADHETVPQPARPVRPAPVQASPEELAEACRIAQIAQDAVNNASDLADLAERLEREGIFLRPMLNRELELHGMRFSTPGASLTGSTIGLGGSVLNAIGLRYRHPEHQSLIWRLVANHDAAMGSIGDLKNRFTAVPPRKAPFCRGPVGSDVDPEP